MNKSNLLHAGLGVALQIIVAIITGNWWYGFFLSTGIFWGREHAQKQTNIAKHRGCTVKDLEWYDGADMRIWSKDSLWDFSAPFIVTLIVAIVCSIVLI